MKTILLIGLGRFGRHIVMKLNELKHQVMAVDQNEERVNAILPFVTNAQIGDSTSAEFLADLGVRNFDVCIVAIGDNFQSSLETASLLKELGAKKWWQGPPGMYRPNSCCATVRMRWYIRRNRWLSGLPFDTALTIFLITFLWAMTMRSSRWRSRTAGSGKPFGSWTFGNGFM